MMESDEAVTEQSDDLTSSSPSRKLKAGDANPSALNDPKSNDSIKKPPLVLYFKPSSSWLRECKTISKQKHKTTILFIVYTD
jgi:hypothetical protein